MKKPKRTRFETVRHAIPTFTGNGWTEGLEETALIASFTPDYFPVKDKEGKRIGTNVVEDKRLMICHSSRHYNLPSGYMVLKDKKELEEKFQIAL